MKNLPLASALLSALALLASPLRSADDTKAVVSAKVDADYPQLKAFYEDLHLHPELSLMEERTSGKVAAELRAAGYEVTEKFGGYGVVAVLKNGPGPVLLIALPTWTACPVEEVHRATVREPRMGEGSFRA